MLAPYGGVHLLLDNLTEIGGVTFFGSPWCPNFGGKWAFEMEEKDLAEKYQFIEQGEGGPLVVVSHTPAFGVCDVLFTEKYGKEFYGKHLGSTALAHALAVSKADIPLVLCGHIHGSRGEKVWQRASGMTLVQNVSALDEDYKPVEEPWMVFDLDEDTDTVQESVLELEVERLNGTTNSH
jgi:Icc-related predicted phosphoesterase